MVLKKLEGTLENVGPDTYRCKTVKNRMKNEYGELVQFTRREEHKRSDAPVQL